MKRKITAILLVVALVLSLSLVTAVPVAAADVNPGDSIQDAIDAALPGDIITVATGTYNENVVIDKSLTLEAASRPVINGDTDADDVPDGSCITVSANGVTINGFELTNGYNGIIGETSGSTIQNCVIHDNLNYGGSNGVGILLWGDNDDNEILGNEIYNNDRQGIFIGYGDDSKISEGNTISGNTIYNNGLYTQANGPDASAYGIQLWNADENTIEGNEVYNHDDWFPYGGTFDFAQGIYLCASFDNTVRCNDLHHNNYGVGAWSAGRTPVGSNQITCNNIVDNTGFGVINYDTVIIDATNNWWGDVSGPYHSTNSDGLGDDVSDNVTYEPWSYTPDPCCPKTMGFWKNHPASVDSVLEVFDESMFGPLPFVIGAYVVSDFEGIELIFDSASGKYAENMLAAQFLAGFLNGVHLEWHLGIDICEDAEDALLDAFEALDSASYNGPDSLEIKGKDKKPMLDIAEILDSFNNGELCGCLCEWD